MNKKVMLITHIFPPINGGSGRWFMDLYSRLDGVDITVVTDNIPRHLKEVRTSKFEVFRVDFSSSTFGLSQYQWGIMSIRSVKYYWSLISKISKLLKQKRIDEVHCGKVLQEGLIGYILNVFYKTPYIVYIHGEEVEACLQSRELKFLVTLILNSAKKIICNSNNTSSLLSKWDIKKIEKIAILHPGVDSNVFKPNSTLLSSSDVLLTVSRLQKRKGHDVLIEAMTELVKEFESLKYVIIGGGEELESINQLIQKNNLEEHVFVLGECSDSEIVEWYQKADLFVLPNRAIGTDIEGFGIVLLEAQSCATPVIAGDSGGTKETLIEGETGYVLDCRNPKLLTEKITMLLRNKTFLREMGNKARLHVDENFSWNVQNDKAKRLFDLS